MGRGPSIEGRKNATDAKRGKIFTKIIREISVAARAGGGDPNNNPRLRVAVDKGLSANMTKDVIERAIKKATGELEGVEYEEIRYEGYAPGGVAVIVDCLTDNKTRTVADVRHAFNKYGGNMGTDGCVKCKFMDCVEVCPVDCFYEGENFLVIAPDECIDCGVCEPECPVDAIVPDTEDEPDGKWLQVNAEYAKVWPNITVKGTPPADREQYERETGKYEKYFSPKPGKGS